MASLTTHLLNLDPTALTQATQHPFLTAAATSTLPKSKLQAWLGQDRLYQIAYLPFIGTLLSRIGIPDSADREATLEWRTADLLLDALTNIRDEMRLFESTAEGEGWLDAICGVQAGRQTRAYQDLFAGATAQGRGVVVGLVVLWATESCYLRAWRWAKGQVTRKEGDGEGDVMQRTFIPAWSSGEFEGFVERIRGVVDEFGEQMERDGREWRECEAAWRQVLWAEREFWPDV
ncbi:hypothetical protein BDY17DRAFT_92299 [Neohortaea acidophila]|uniref:Thiaminase-2/PQQC domain-containing protein n=1 Tax=Neohortaea acidophila TaxID=245834 RepID=A0A6A6Q0A3_9PEZI|nr:uncharacterized protein BDY17DRAFT_92299 [Neohortaea acidophila]KAF2484847.1 hypothetical protein BDY17DRAFT_92299 [Neohortaea acidophila]